MIDKQKIEEETSDLSSITSNETNSNNKIDVFKKQKEIEKRQKKENPVKYQKVKPPKDFKNSLIKSFLD